jgi:hypothetical protein
MLALQITFCSCCALGSSYECGIDTVISQSTILYKTREKLTFQRNRSHVFSTPKKYEVEKKLVLPSSSPPRVSVHVAGSRPASLSYFSSPLSSAFSFLFDPTPRAALSARPTPHHGRPLPPPHRRRPTPPASTNHRRSYASSPSSSFCAVGHVAILHRRFAPPFCVVVLRRHLVPPASTTRPSWRLFCRTERPHSRFASTPRLASPLRITLPIGASR